MDFYNPECCYHQQIQRIRLRVRAQLAREERTMVGTTSNETAAAVAVDTEGLKAWHMLTKSGPVTQATFLAWYATTHKKKKTTKRGASTATLSTSKPAAKKQRQGGVRPGSTAAAEAVSQQPTTLLTKGKRTAPVKALTSSLKASIKAKKTKWHAGDHDVKAGTAVMDATDFVALFPGVRMTRKGVTTSFSLTQEVLIDTLGDFKLSIPTWSRPGNFRKAYTTGSKSVSLHRADGKYSTGTSTLTLKFALSIGGSLGHRNQRYLPQIPRQPPPPPQPLSSNTHLIPDSPPISSTAADSDC